MEELNQEATAENLIKSLELIYFDLRENHPDRDEHWFLANTWLNRYSSTEEAQQRGAEWAKFVAYRDTHRFAILEPPESIRGLALSLVYKELGEKQAEDHEKEFLQIMEQIVKSRAEGEFLDKYKERNPLTWEEIQLETDSSYSLYWFFKGLELEQECDEEFDEVWGEVGIDIIDKIEEEEQDGD